ncbi:MAG: DNA replication protein, partial [Alphaproteobacteria bacterium]|nr:DNA replication protein [Alphaproteobacteria bacterium]
MVGPCNQVAVDWLDRYPAWPGPVTVLCGAPGSGKSHLLAVWSHAAGALVLQGPDLKVTTLDDVVGTAQAIAVDVADVVREP